MAYRFKRGDSSVEAGVRRIATEEIGGATGHPPGVGQPPEPGQAMVTTRSLRGSDPRRQDVWPGCRRAPA